jgi:hypothetical protein
MNFMALEFANVDPCEQRYHLRCKIVVKQISYLDRQSKKSTQETAKFVFLEPQATTQSQLFLSAWLPDGSDGKNHYEVGLTCGHPVNRAFRASIHNRDERHDRPYLMVLTLSAEKDFVDFMEGRYGPSKWKTFMSIKRWIKSEETIDVTVMRATEEATVLGGATQKAQPISNYKDLV